MNFYPGEAGCTFQGAVSRLLALMWETEGPWPVLGTGTAAPASTSFFVLRAVSRGLNLEEVSGPPP